MKDKLPDHEKYRRARQRMVRQQLLERGIYDQRVLQTMGRLPREAFVPLTQLDRAYDDTPLPIAGNQTISQPYIVALMTQLLKLHGSEKTLEIGTGSGYQTAILADLCLEVFSIERTAELLEEARKTLESFNYTNVHLTIGDGTLGWLEQAPFDRIIVTAAAPALPETLMSQLQEDGILIVPVGDRYQQDLKVIRREGNRYHTDSGGGCVFVPLIGKEGWPES